MTGTDNTLWIVKEKQPVLLDRLRSVFPQLPPLVLQVLLNRGLETAAEVRSFLEAGISSLHDPFLLPDMEAAAARIGRALDAGEKMMVFGDYDVDGITATALLCSGLTRLGGQVIHCLPERLRDGYGLSRQGVEYARAREIDLVVTVDCGSTDYAELDCLRRSGIDVVVTDHHELDGKIPAAAAVVNPRRPDSRYPFSHLSGVGLAYKLLQALCRRRPGSPPAPEDYLDLVALGTVADVAPLTGENRILVRHGLSALMRTRNFGLQALIEESGLGGRRINSSHLGYILGPRLNAGGRMGSPEQSLRLLLTSSPAEAGMLAAALGRDNRRRQELESAVLKKALVLAEEQLLSGKDRVIVLNREEWHPGVSGIVASRLVDHFHRPALIITGGEGICRGSGRSIRNFHLRRALEECRELLTEFGGHEYACGLTIAEENVDAFRERMNEIAGNWLTPEDLFRRIEVDAEISFSELTGETVSRLEALAPFGVGNPRPIFLTRGLKTKGTPSPAERGDWRVWITDGNLTQEAVIPGKKRAELEKRLPGPFSAVFSPLEKSWQGRKVISLQIKGVGE